MSERAESVQSGNEKRRNSQNKTPSSARSTKSNSPSRLTSNKLYRAPPTPTPEKLLSREKTFTLDCIAVSNISNDYSRANPKLGQVAPPYNAQKDHNCGSYFGFIGVEKTLQSNEQEQGGCSIDGPVYERFFKQGAGFKYLTRRNMTGAGHSKEQVSGHAQFMQGIKPINGFNGQFGYRRTTPSLRKHPSEFGVATCSPIYWTNLPVNTCLSFEIKLRLQSISVLLTIIHCFISKRETHELFYNRVLISVYLPNIFH